MPVRLAPWLFALLVAGPAAAGQVTIYRCTDADGALALRDSPCPPGEQQQLITMERPQDPPPQPEPEPQPAPAAAAAPAATPPTIVTRVVVVDPPEVYACVTPDGEHYTSDSPDGNLRWVPLWTLGYPVARVRRPWHPARTRNGNAGNDFLHNDLVFDGIGRPPPEPSSDRPGAPRLPPAVGLARTPGTWIRDRCHRLPPAAACASLRERRDQLDDRYDRASRSEREPIKAELRALEARLASGC